MTIPSETVTRTHDLKILPEFFESWMKGRKRAEVRRSDDRDFKVGDTVNLWEFKKKKYTGRVLRAEVLHIDDVGSVVDLSGCMIASRAGKGFKKVGKFVVLSMAVRKIFKKMTPPAV